MVNPLWKVALLVFGMHFLFRPSRPELESSGVRLGLLWDLKHSMYRSFASEQFCFYNAAVISSFVYSDYLSECRVLQESADTSVVMFWVFEEFSVQDWCPFMNIAEYSSEIYFPNTPIVIGRHSIFSKLRQRVFPPKITKTA
jgi:hypothetical protein